MHKSKACPLHPIESISAPIPIDPKSDKTPEGEHFIAFSHKIDGKYGEYSVSLVGGKEQGTDISIVNLTYFKQSGVQKVKIRVCGSVQNSPDVAYLNFKFGAKVIKVRAFGTQNLVYSVPKAANTTTIQTVLEVEPPKR
jgi:hypothetical protein